eukprot:153615_1
MKQSSQLFEVDSNVVSVDKSIHKHKNSYDSKSRLLSDSNKETLNKNKSDPISTKNKLLGTLCCIISMICWISQAHVVKDVQDEYNKPFFLMYICGVSYITLYPLWYGMTKYTKYQNDKLKCLEEQTQKNKYNSFYYMFKLLFFPSIILALMNLFVEFTWALSLNETMVSVNTAIFQTMVAIVYILSVLFLGMKVTYAKTLGVIICLIGVIVLSLNEEIGPDDVKRNTAKGIIIIGISTILSSFLVIGIEYVSKKHFAFFESQNMIFLQILMGCCYIFLFWPFFFIFDALNVEIFELPSTNEQWVAIVLQTILSVGYYVAYFVGVTITNAMFVSVIMLFILPIGYFSDVIVYEYIPNIWAFIGTLGIIIGFLLIELPVFDFIKKKLGTNNITEI